MTLDELTEVIVVVLLRERYPYPEFFRRVRRRLFEEALASTKTKYQAIKKLGISAPAFYHHWRRS